MGTSDTSFTNVSWEDFVYHYNERFDIEEALDRWLGADSVDIPVFSPEPAMIIFDEAEIFGTAAISNDNANEQQMTWEEMMQLKEET